MKRAASLIGTVFCLLTGTFVTGLAAGQFITPLPAVQSDTVFLVITLAGSVVTAIATMACARPDWMPEIMTSAFYTEE